MNWNGLRAGLWYDGGPAVGVQVKASVVAIRLWLVLVHVEGGIVGNQPARSGQLVSQVLWQGEHGLMSQAVVKSKVEGTLGNTVIDLADGEVERRDTG